jgi:2-oxoglutarate ferredoxin oxidoreductase subunit beta
MTTAEPLKSHAHEPKDYKSTVKPIWCPGCGHFGVQAALFRAFAYLDLAPEQVVIISGIGCSSRLPAYTSCYGFHGVHGRALPLATGLKLARPELTVVVVGGDGDGFSIGGNHFLHACRRNVDMTYVVMDNEVYGMTKGQPSPTTEPDWDSKIAPGGTGIRPFQPLAVALASGANFIARGYAGHPNEVARMLAEAIRHPGFSFLQVLSQCPTYRPEEKAWKQKVHGSDLEPTSDLAEAARRLASDDNLTTGLFYRGLRKPYAASVHSLQDNLAAIEESFTV